MAESMLTREQLLAQLSEQGVEVSYRTLRYYSSLGLIPNATMQRDADGRSRGHYPETTADCVAIILLLQARELNLQQIKESLQFIRSQATESRVEAVREWRRRIADTGSLPLLYELIPQFGDGLRRHLAHMLCAAGLPPVIDSLQQVRLSLTAPTGTAVDRLLFVTDDSLAVNQLNFWELSELTELLSRTSDNERHRTLIQVRTWLQGRNDWALEDFWLARYRRRPVGCLGLHRPWPLRLLSTAMIFGPLIEAEYSALGIEQRLLAKASERARALGLTSLFLRIDEEASISIDWQSLGLNVAGQGHSCLVPTAAAKTVSMASVQPLQSSLLAVLFPEKPPILLTQAATDASTPGWALLNAHGQPVAAIWLNTADQEIWLHQSATWDNRQAELPALLETVKSAARAKGVFHLRLWLPDEVQLPGILERQKQTVLRLDLPKEQPDHQ